MKTEKEIAKESLQALMDFIETPKEKMYPAYGDSAIQILAKKVNQL